RWLMDRWGELRVILERGLKWQAPDRFKAIRMLGAQPMDAADDQRVLSIYLACDAMDPKAMIFQDLACELGYDEAERYTERVQGRGYPGLKLADPVAGREVLLAIVGQVVARLEVLLGVHREREAAGELGWGDAHAFDDSAEGK